MKLILSQQQNASMRQVAQGFASLRGDFTSIPSMSVTKSSVQTALANMVNTLIEVANCVMTKMATMFKQDGKVATWKKSKKRIRGASPRIAGIS